MDEHFRLISGSIIAFNFAVLLGAIANGSDSLIIVVALTIASIGFPAAVGAWIINQSDDVYPGKGTWSILLVLGASCGLVSMAILIYSISLYAFIAFSVTSTVTTYLVVDYMRKTFEVIKTTNN